MMRDDELRDLLEEIMSTSTERPATTTDDVATTDNRSRRRMLVGGLAAAAAAVGIAIATVAVTSDDQSESRQSLAVAAAGTTMTSCLPFDVSMLADMPVAFAGTVTEISDTMVTIDVERWYRTPNDETDLVDLSLPAENTSAALDGVEFAAGERYLITATDGNVNGCGFSGPATADLESAFESAFVG
ncbi:MAG: hypothetical protein H0U21_13680 [Acidimicrobiia bacterium]|nr:hypothetical protein [Acidimicrobiia bacterium]